MTQTLIAPSEITAPAPCINFTEDVGAFKRTYRASRNSWRTNNLSPLRVFFEANPDTSITRDRRFGIEIELNNDYESIGDSDDVYCECSCVCIEFCETRECREDCTCDTDDGAEHGCECYCWMDCDNSCYGDDCMCFEDRHDNYSRLSQWLYDSNLTRNPTAEGYHSGGYNYEQWRFEGDCTVSGGEVISPVLDDNGDSWALIQSVMNMAMEYDSTAHESNCGGHISIDVPDLSGNEDMMRRLLMIVSKFEDVVYRLATNPKRGNDWGVASRHRGQMYARPIQSEININGDIRSMQRALTLGHGWMNYVESCNRLEFRIFDGTLDVALSQTFAMIAGAIVDASANRHDLDNILAEMPNRPLGWHIAQRREAGYQARTALSGEAWGKDTIAVRQFVDMLFDNTHDKERVITLFSMNDWSH